MKLSPDQSAVYGVILDWARAGSIPLLTLGGYAGTGKTTLAAQFALQMQKQRRIGFCALSGRAASVLGGKLQQAGFDFGDRHSCSTIHRLIYKPIVNESTGEVEQFVRKDKLECNLIVLDEASMVSQQVYDDLASYGVPILAIGDHGQLPPVDGNFSLMEAPQLRLEQIHRQAEGNPIIRLSADIRGGAPIQPWCADNQHIFWWPKADWRACLEKLYAGKTPKQRLDATVLCYTNRVRSRFNGAVRQMLGLQGVENPNDPVSGDLVICLRNIRDLPIFNGYRGIITEPALRKHHVDADVSFPAEGLDTSLRMSRHQFGYEKTFRSFDELAHRGCHIRSWEGIGKLFDYGYVMTTHKAQGSQFDDVALCLEQRPQKVSEESYQRWLYTAVTRAAERLTVIG